jgi:aspartyl-tRNA(Asn)/glutamyl-tRNA(Gln) amidotransferase subunit C
MDYNTVSIRQKHVVCWQIDCKSAVFLRNFSTCNPREFRSSRMKLTPDELKRIAHLAKIAVSDADVATLQTQLTGIFGLIDELQAVDTKGVEPLAHPLDVVQHMAQRLRTDVVSEKDTREANMANAPAQERGLFLVPKVLE